MRARVLGLLVAASLLGCGDEPEAAPADDGSVAIDVDVPDSTATPETPATGRSACLDRPDLPQAPSTSLPCELIPPGLTLP